MQRIDQTQFGVRGNCQSACLAMLLGLPLEQVPNFLETPGADRDDAVAFNAQRAWLRERGWTIITLTTKATGIRYFTRGYVIAGGMSSRGYPHSVIVRNAELWHDPHPSRAGLVEITEIDLLIPLDPARFADVELQLRKAENQRSDFRRQLTTEREGRMAAERIVDEVRARNRELEAITKENA